MSLEEREEFITFLLIENNCYNNIKFSDYIKNNYNVSEFNKRYKELLDKFLNNYALNKTEKSDNKM